MIRASPVPGYLPGKGWDPQSPKKRNSPMAAAWLKDGPVSWLPGYLSFWWKVMFAWTATYRYYRYILLNMIGPICPNHYPWPLYNVFIYLYIYIYVCVRAYLNQPCASLAIYINPQWYPHLQAFSMFNFRPPFTHTGLWQHAFLATLPQPW